MGSGLRGKFKLNVDLKVFFLCREPILILNLHGRMAFDDVIHRILIPPR
ncbi:hypothetical protein AVEN_266107-1, partial [Araneus ventricosus]